MIIYPFSRHKAVVILLLLLYSTICTITLATQGSTPAQTSQDSHTLVDQEAQPAQTSLHTTSLQIPWRNLGKAVIIASLVNTVYGSTTTYDPLTVAIDSTIMLAGLGIITAIDHPTCQKLLQAYGLLCTSVALRWVRDY